MRLLLAALLLVLAAGCGTDHSTGDKGYVAGDQGVTEYAVGQRPKAPAISGTTLQGTKVALHTLAAGRPSVINVWGSWCAECRQETGRLNAAAKQLGDKAAFLGVDVRDNGGTDEPIAFERALKVPYPSLYDPDGRTLLGMPKGIGTYAIPSTVVLDAEGRVAATVIGQVPTALTLVGLVQDAAK